MKGRFIVFEGIDGAGKTTQIQLLAKRLQDEGREVCVTAEPTDSVTGRMLRSALSGKDKRCATEMAALFVLDRIYHNVSGGGIRDMLDRGADVICDRYYYSSLAYQGSLTDFEWVKRMNLDCPDILHPDLCIFLDLEPKVSLERINRNRTSTEIYETEEVLEKVRKQFYRAFEALGDPIAIVDASGGIEIVAEEIYKALN